MSTQFPFSGIVLPGSASQKGTVMGILRSLGCLARALGPVVSSSGKIIIRETVSLTCNFYFSCTSLKMNVCFTVYWIAGAQTCFLLTSAAFVIPLVLLSKASRLKEEWPAWGQNALQDSVFAAWNFCLQVHGVKKHWVVEIFSFCQQQWNECIPYSQLKMPKETKGM